MLSKVHRVKIVAWKLNTIGMNALTVVKLRNICLIDVMCLVFVFYVCIFLPWLDFKVIPYSNSDIILQLLQVFELDCRFYKTGIEKCIAQ